MSSSSSSSSSEDKIKKESSSSSSSLLPTLPTLPSLSSYLPISSIITTIQQQIRQTILNIRTTKESTLQLIDPIIKPKDTFNKIIYEPLYNQSNQINNDYPYISMLCRSQPLLVLGSSLAVTTIPTLLIRRKSFKFMTITTSLVVMSAIGIVNVKWYKEN